MNISGLKNQTEVNFDRGMTEMNANNSVKIKIKEHDERYTVIVNDNELFTEDKGDGITLSPSWNLFEQTVAILHNLRNELGIELHVDRLDESIDDKDTNK